MRPSWKLLGLAGLAGVATTGVVVARRRRAQRQYEPDELRERLHRRRRPSRASDPRTMSRPASATSPGQVCAKLGSMPSTVA